MTKKTQQSLKKIQETLAFVFGIVFVVVLLVLAVAFPNPPPFQYTIFRVVLALATAGVAAMIPGFLQVTIPKWLRAGGALAVLVLVYFYNPAALVSREPTPPDKVPNTILTVVDGKGNPVKVWPGDVCPLRRELLDGDIAAVEIHPSVFKEIEKKGLREGDHVTVINDSDTSKWMKGRIFKLKPILVREGHQLSRAQCAIAMDKRSRVALGIPGDIDVGNPYSSTRKGHKIRVILSSDWPLPSP